MISFQGLLMLWEPQRGEYGRLWNGRWTGGWYGRRAFSFCFFCFFFGSCLVLKVVSFSRASGRVLEAYHTHDSFVPPK